MIPAKRFTGRFPAYSWNGTQPSRLCWVAGVPPAGIYSGQDDRQPAPAGRPCSTGGLNSCLGPETRSTFRSRPGGGLEDGLGEGAGVEDFEVGLGFAGADVAGGDAQFLVDADNDASFAAAVEFGDDDAGELAGGFLEFPGLVEGVGTGGGIDDGVKVCYPAIILPLVRHPVTPDHFSGSAAHSPQGPAPKACLLLQDRIAPTGRVRRTSSCPNSQRAIPRQTIKRTASTADRTRSADGRLS